MTVCARTEDYGEKRSVFKKVRKEKFLTLILRRSRYGNGMVLHFYQQQESSTTKTVHKVINKGLKTYVLSLHTRENFH